MAETGQRRDAAPATGVADAADARRAHRVALGMSGGVDSAVAAVLLARAGFEVLGVTCRFQDGVAAQRACEDAAAVCAHLGIPHIVHDCAALFEREVVSPFVDAYADGFTPSPCVECNARCKVPALMAVACERGCDCMATGHYARIAQLRDSGRFAVLTALDARKDQSYMLALLSQEQLSRLVLPLGGVTKAEVRVMADDWGLSVADKPESQDVCFIEGDYRDFLRGRGVCDQPGVIVNVAGERLGSHDGLARYTVGQRKGIGIAGPEPYYVVEKRSASRELVVGFARDAAIAAVRTAPVRWQALDGLTAPREAMVKLRYRSRAVACIIEPQEQGRARVILREPQPTTAPGQYAVFYDGAAVLGGGMIEEVERA